VSESQDRAIPEAGTEPITAFTMRGLRNGSPVHITWSDGHLSGDPPTVDLLEVEAEIEAVGGLDHMARRAGTTPSPHPLADVATAARLAYRVIDRVTEVHPPGIVDMFERPTGR
jgi:hypothetical protein